MSKTIENIIFSKKVSKTSNPAVPPFAKQEAAQVLLPASPKWPCGVASFPHGKWVTTQRVLSLSIS